MYVNTVIPFTMCLWVGKALPAQCVQRGQTLLAGDQADESS